MRKERKTYNVDDFIDRWQDSFSWVLRYSRNGKRKELIKLEKLHREWAYDSLFVKNRVIYNYKSQMKGSTRLGYLIREKEFREAHTVCHKPELHDKLKEKVQYMGI